MAITLDTSEKNEVRAKIHLYVTPELVSDTIIDFDTNTGAACDYVFAEVIKDMPNPPTDLIAFLNEQLIPRQVSQFRRAVIYYTAGIISADVVSIIGERAGSISQAFGVIDWETKQQSLFNLADAEIKRLRDSLPESFFQNPAAVPQLFSVTGA